MAKRLVEDVPLLVLSSSFLCHLFFFSVIRGRHVCSCSSAGNDQHTDNQILIFLT